MEGFKSVCDVYRVLQKSPTYERIVASSHTPSRGDNVPTGGIYCTTGCTSIDLTARVPFSNLLYLIDSMLVQLARDLGGDFYHKYWVRSITLLSQTMNHAEFPVIEVCLFVILTKRSLRSIHSRGC